MGISLKAVLIRSINQRFMKRNNLPFQIMKVKPYKFKAIKKDWTQEEWEREMSSESMQKVNMVAENLIILDTPEEYEKFKKANNL